jgi:hypothetical protein
MARQLNEVFELEKEITGYREALILIKTEIHRIREEYFQGAQSLGTQAVEEVDEELETISLVVENALF